MTLKLGVIGTGAIGQEHIRRCNNVLQGARVVAVSDINVEGARAALQRLKTSYEPQEASSMMAFCINGKSKSWSEFFMTHPPLDKRIEALRSGEYLK